MEQYCSLLFSCENVKEQSEIYENKISSPKSLPFAASSAEFLAHNESSSNASMLNNECSCEYKILNVDLPPLSGINERNIVELYSYDNCLGGAECPLFTTNFTSDGLCISNFGNCHQAWGDLLVDYEPFSCLIDAYSGFYNFNFSSYQTGVNGIGCGGFQNPGNPKITISIRCTKEGDSECGGTDTNTLIIDTDNFEILGKFVTGGECGCVPHFLKYQNPDDPS